MLYPYNGIFPKVHESVFIAPGAHLIGDVVVGENSSIWFNAVIRGDENTIKIGQCCSIQDNSSLHQSWDNPIIVEDGVTVGHNVTLHGCKIGKRSIIGMGTTILDGAEIGEECIVGANALILRGKKIPPQSLVIGSPGKVVREINVSELERIQLAIDIYVQKAKDYKKALGR